MLQGLLNVSAIMQCGNYKVFNISAASHIRGIACKLRWCVDISSFAAFVSGIANINKMFVEMLRGRF